MFTLWVSRSWCVLSGLCRWFMSVKCVVKVVHSYYVVCVDGVCILRWLCRWFMRIELVFRSSCVLSVLRRWFMLIKWVVNLVHVY